MTLYWQCITSHATKYILVDVNIMGPFSHSLHHSRHGIVAEICHSNLVNISGISMHFPVVYVVHYDWQMTVLGRKINTGLVPLS